MDYLQRTEGAAGGGYVCVAGGPRSLASGMYVFTPKLSEAICYLLKCGASSKMRAVAHRDGAGDLLIENLGLKLAPPTCLPRTSLSIRFLAK